MVGGSSTRRSTESRQEFQGNNGGKAREHRHDDERQPSIHLDPVQLNKAGCNKRPVKHEQANCHGSVVRGSARGHNE